LEFGWSMCLQPLILLAASPTQSDCAVKSSKQTAMHDLPSPEAAGLFRPSLNRQRSALPKSRQPAGASSASTSVTATSWVTARGVGRARFPDPNVSEDLPADLDNMRRLVAGEIREFTREKRYRRRDGHIVWVNVTVSPLWAPGEAPEFHVLWRRTSRPQRDGG